MPDAHNYYLYIDPDRNPAFRAWSRRIPPRDAGALDRAADIELAHGHYAAADRLAWLAAGVRDGAP